MGFGSDIFPCTYVEISANHIGLDLVILLFPYAKIRDNHFGLGSAILPCPYVEIRDNNFGLVTQSFLYICRNHGYR
jgi:hypothetical protein